MEPSIPTSLKKRSEPIEPQLLEDINGTLETVLVPISNSDVTRMEAIADTVAEVAEPTGAVIHILHIFTASRYEERIIEANLDTPTNPDAVAKRATPVHDLIRELDRPHRNPEVPIDVKGRVSETVSETIINVANEINAHRIVIGGRKRRPTGKAVFGSTAQKVLLDAPCPVTFVRDSHHDW